MSEAAAAQTTVWDGKNRRTRERWHVDRSVDIGVILVVVAQVGLGIWYASDFNAWRRSAETTLARHEAAIIEGAVKGQTMSQEVTDRLARIETKLDVLAVKR